CATSSNACQPPAALRITKHCCRGTARQLLSRLPENKPRPGGRDLWSAYVTFLRYIRLHGARQELITEPSGKYLISEIAARWGFWTPGIFCNYYKELFGETPTAT